MVCYAMAVVLLHFTCLGSLRRKGKVVIIAAAIEGANATLARSAALLSLTIEFPASVWSSEDQKPIRRWERVFDPCPRKCNL